MRDLEAQVDDDDVRLMSLRVFKYKEGELVSLLVHLGDRLGLYRVMAGAGPLTSAELADRAGLHERWVREWLYAQAAAQLLDHVPAPSGEDRFELGRAAEAVLVDEEGSLFFAAGAFGEPMAPDVVAELADAFRTGIGLPYDRLGPSAAHRTGRSLGPWSRLALVPLILPVLEGVLDKLQAGADVADIGCGTGVAIEALADAFPASRFTGYDLSSHAVVQARERLAGRPNVEIVQARAEEVPGDGRFDLALTFDCLHDMTQPQEALRAIRRSLRDDGTLLVKEIRCAPTFAGNARNPVLALMYGFSVTSCMSSAMSEPGGAGLGTLGLHGERLREMAGSAGFTRIRTHDVGEPTNLYYELRP